MPVPVFEQPEIHNDKKESPLINIKTSGVAILFAIFLVSVSIFTSELFLRDINKYFNNEYNDCHYSATSNSLVNNIVLNEECDLKSYEGLRLLVHVDVLMPIVIIGLIILLTIRHKKLSSYYRVLRIAYLFFTIWLTLRLIGETEYYVITHHPIYGKYLILFTIIVILIYLVIYIQKKFVKRPQ
ncbi:MAG: hypothetical protein ACNFW9_02580 [Candidatus Kerfeldbacteria bacterium]